MQFTLSLAYHTHSLYDFGILLTVLHGKVIVSTQKKTTCFKSNIRELQATREEKMIFLLLKKSRR